MKDNNKKILKFLTSAALLTLAFNTTNENTVFEQDLETYKKQSRITGFPEEYKTNRINETAEKLEAMLLEYELPTPQ